MILTVGLEKHYGRVKALQGLEMHVPERAVYGLIGPNGSGKTTTLRILAGLLLPTAGEARVAGYDVLRQPYEVRGVIGYMPDFFGVYDDLRAGEYLEFYAAAYGIRGRAAKKLCDDLLELVDLADKRDAFVDTLSRGMQQRLCLARTLIHDPPVLLLDEPASGLDPLARVEIRELLKELCRLGKTIVISSHILSELADLCTHIGMVAEGRLLCEGPLNVVLAAAQKRKFSLRCHGPVAAALEILAGWPGVEILDQVGSQVEFSLADGPEETAALLRALAASDARVVHFAETEQSLEDTFLRLVREAQG